MAVQTKVRVEAAPWAVPGAADGQGSLMAPCMERMERAGGRDLVP